MIYKGCDKIEMSAMLFFGLKIVAGVLDNTMVLQEN